MFEVILLGKTLCIFLGLILLLNLPTNLLVPILPDMSIPMAKVFSYDHLQLTELGMVRRLNMIFISKQ